MGNPLDGTDGFIAQMRVRRLGVNTVDLMPIATRSLHDEVGERSPRSPNRS